MCVFHNTVSCASTYSKCLENYISIIRTKVFLCVSPQITDFEPGFSITSMDGLLLKSWGPFVTGDAWVSSIVFSYNENTNVLIYVHLLFWKQAMAQTCNRHVRDDFTPV